MSTGVIASSGEQLPETVYVCTKKLGIEPRKQIAVQNESIARKWLRDEIIHDLAMSESFQWKEYDKLVAESDDGEVYGHIQEVPTATE